MMAVASYGAEDYYKCKYCRYVAPFDSLAEQNYVKSPYSTSVHKCLNTTPGLSYTFYELHNYISYEQCNNNTYHTSICECGYESQAKHIVTQISPKIGTCILCGASVTIGSGTIMPWGDNDGEVSTYALEREVQVITDNGSYILPDGVIVLVEEDIEAYLNGELILPE